MLKICFLLTSDSCAFEFSGVEAYMVEPEGVPKGVERVEPFAVCMVVLLEFFDVLG